MNTPFDNCKFQICDLPGQCKGEGKCHHPAKHAKDEITLPITEYEQLMADKKRLDWIDENSKDYSTHLEVRIKDSCVTTLREAIDQAMNDR
jgi:hypothetical protein